jgi:hypothetical protein
MLRRGPDLRSSPRPAYARGFGGLAAPVRRSSKSEGGKRGPRATRQAVFLTLDSRFRGNERKMFWWTSCRTSSTFSGKFGFGGLALGKDTLDAGEVIVHGAARGCRIVRRDGLIDGAVLGDGLVALLW